MKIIDISETIRNNENLNMLFNIRENIILGNNVEVPENTFNFFEQYRKIFKSKSIIVKTNPIPSIKSKTTEPLMLWKSEGADSTFIHLSMPQIPCYRATNFIPNINYKHKRDFQLLLVGSHLGFAYQMTGTQDSYDMDDTDNWEAYEFSNDFIKSWNETFESKALYPLSHTNKIAIYKGLLEKKIPFSSCEKGLCGSCYKCFEHAMLAKAVGGYDTPLPFIPNKESFKEKIDEIMDIIENHKVDGRALAYHYLEVHKLLGFDFNSFMESL